jgi:hypothetical protein
MIKKIAIVYFLGIVSIYLLCSFYSLNINFFNWEQNVRKHFVTAVVIIDILTFICCVFGSLENKELK